MVIGLMVPILNVVSAGLFSRRCLRGSRERTFEGLFGLSLAIHGLWASCHLLPARILEGIGGESGSALLVLQVAGPCLQMAAILSWHEPGSSKAYRWRELLDAVIFTSALLLVFWLCGLRAFLVGGSLDALQIGMHLFYFFAYALLMGLVLFQGLNRPGRFSGSMGWIFAALGTITAGNLLWIVLNLQHPVASLRLLDLLAIPIAAFYLMSALVPSVQRAAKAPRDWATGHMLAPYLPVFLAMPLVMTKLAKGTGAANTPVFACLLGLFLLVLGRQLVALWDLRRFSRDLESLVKKRTETLEDLQGHLIRNQKMNLLATLGAGLAHDLKNLIGVVNLSMSLVRDDLAEGRIPPVEDLDLLQSTTEKVNALAENLLAYGRPGEPQPRVFDLNEHLEATLPLLERLAGEPIKIAWDPAEGTLLLDLDPHHLEQVLVNLVANARDAMPGGGTLHLGTRRQGDPGASSVLLEIRDTGCGIPPDHMPHLFEPFFTTKDPGHGTGLGLASVKAITDECGATLQVESQLGRGTTFRLQFPLANV